MTNEIVLGRLDNILSDLTRLGGASERTGIQTGLVVVDIAPTGLTNHIIVQDNRDGDYIPVLKSPGAVYAVNNLVSVLFIEGTEPIAFQQSPGSSSPASLTEFGTFIVKNTSGATANANDVGYITGSEYKTTTTANLDTAWCVVIQGAANNADIYVARRGRVTVAYAGSAPADGDFLVTSTTAGSASAQTTMRPEIFARCIEAGSGGTVQALLLTERKFRPIVSSANLYECRNADPSDFVAVIAAAGVDVANRKVYHDPATSGTQNNANPGNTNEVAKIVLHNTSTGLSNTEAYIETAGTDATDDFIQVTNGDDIDGWVTSDSITIRSQTNTSSGGSPAAYFYDMDLSIEDEVPELSTSMVYELHRFDDAGTTIKFVMSHPYESNSGPKRVTNTIYEAPTFTAGYMLYIGLFSRRFCIRYFATGSATLTMLLRIRGAVVAAP